MNGSLAKTTYHLFKLHNSTLFYPPLSMHRAFQHHPLMERAQTCVLLIRCEKCIKSCLYWHDMKKTLGHTTVCFSCLTYITELKPLTHIERFSK